MFGFVMANAGELSKPQLKRYNSVYCGICKEIRRQAGEAARLGLRYDMAFLALLLMSLYEPEETGGKQACSVHPFRPRPYVENEFVEYSAAMNISLAYFKARDDVRDSGSLWAKTASKHLAPYTSGIAEKYPRQWDAVSRCMEELTQLEKDRCASPDLPAGCFGRLMGELLVFREDLWSEDLREMGMALGRFIYLADAAVDYRGDKKHGRYNPFLAAGMAEDWTVWEQYLVLAMARCTRAFERLPLVQDKPILDNILYSGIWVSYRQKEKKITGGNHGA